MATRFRRSLKIAPGLWLNASKTGFGVSMGVKGARIGINPQGRAYASASVPGTGFYAINYSGAGSRQATPPAESGGASPVYWALGLFAIFLLSLVSLRLTAFAVVAWALGYTAYQLTPWKRAARTLRKAAPLLDQCDYEGALPILEKAYQTYRSDDTKYLIAGTLNNLGRFEEALPLAQQMHARRPQSDVVTIMLANAYLQTGQHAEALALAQGISEESAWYLKAVSLTGSCFAGQGQHELAIEAFKKAPLLKRNLDEDLLDIHYKLADTYLEMGSKRKARQHLNRIVAHDAGYRDAGTRLESL